MLCPVSWRVTPCGFVETLRTFGEIFFLRVPLLPWKKVSVRLTGELLWKYDVVIDITSNKTLIVSSNVLSNIKKSTL